MAQSQQFVHRATIRATVVETFDDFLAAMDDQLNWLAEEGRKRGINLTKGLADFENLEALFDDLATGASKSDVAGLTVVFGRHLGEVMLACHGGAWHLPLDDPKSVNFNTPVIIGHSQVQGLEFAPLSVMRAYALRRRPGTLRRAFEAQTVPGPLDLSDLIESG